MRAINIKKCTLCYCVHSAKLGEIIFESDIQAQHFKKSRHVAAAVCEERRHHTVMVRIYLILIKSLVHR